MNETRGKIKIVHIITRMDRGGAPDIVRLLFEKLPSDTFDLTLIYGRTLQPSLKILEFIQKLGVRAICVPTLRRDINPFYDFIAWLKLISILRKGRFDVVHTHTAKAGFLGRVAAKMAGAHRVIYSPHGHDFYGYFGKWGSRMVVCAEKFAALFCDRIHALTELEKKDFLSFYICFASKIEVISSGVELDALRPTQRLINGMKNEFLEGEKIYLVGMVGRLEPVKGPVYFIEAAKLVLRKKKNVKFYVVGEGSLRGALEKEVREAGIEERFIFTGWKEDVSAILFTLDLLVLPSLNEAVGRSALEAQAAGVPVVATRVGGVSEVIKDGVTGVLVEPKSAPALASAILSLLNDEAKRISMGEAGRGWVDERFSDRTMADKFKQLYSDLMKCNSSRTFAKKFLIVCLTGLALFLHNFDHAYAQEHWEPMAMHIATTVSDGSLDLSEIVGLARTKGVKVLVITDRDFMKWEYGLWPLRNLIKKTVESNSVFKYGIDKYLKDIALESSKNNDMVIVPGLESAPFYYWSGFPWAKNLKISDWHKHLLVVGLGKPEDIRSLPVVANKHYLMVPFGSKDIFFFWPLLLFFLGLFFLRKREFGYKDDKGREWGRFSKKDRVIGLVIVCGSLLFILNNAPFRSFAYDPYARNAGVRPYQILIDDVNRKGGVTFWAHPEAKNISKQGDVRIETWSHVEDLHKTQDYSGFAIFQEGYEQAGKVGSDWDALLGAYCRGDRKSPVWVVTGLAFDFGTKQDFLDLLDIFGMYASVSSLDEKSVVAALRQGKVYVSRGFEKNKLLLEEFYAVDPLSGEKQGVGATLRLSGDPVLKIKGRYAVADPGTALVPKIGTKLIRNGRVVKVFDSVGPLDISYVDEGLAWGKSYYRLEIQNGGQFIVTNPIFVEKTGS
jgi:glycosyltransferase involved in cell wall biosynthesis